MNLFVSLSLRRSVRFFLFLFDERFVKKLSLTFIDLERLTGTNYEVAIDLPRNCYRPVCNHALQLNRVRGTRDRYLITSVSFRFVSSWIVL